MANPVTFMQVIQSNLAPIYDALGPTDAAKFEEDYHRLVESAQNHPDAPEIYERLQQLFKNYPAAAQVLLQITPALFDAPTSTTLPPVRGVSDEDQRMSNATTSGQLRTGHPGEIDLPREQSIQGQLNQAREPVTSRDPTPQSSTEDKLRQWTPELTIQLFKEIVAAVMGLFLVGFTLYIAFRTFGFIGDVKKLPDAKDLLLLLLSLSGVVIGYYFGRVPADARAAQAQKQANDADAQSQRIGAKAEQTAQYLDDIMSTSITRGGNGTLTPDELKQLRDKLRNLADLSRTH